MNPISRNGRLLIAALALMILVYMRGSTWNHLPSTGFWITAFAIIIALGILGIMLLIAIFRFITSTRRSVRDLVLLILTLGILIITVFGMK